MGDYCGGTDISILSLRPQEDSDCGVLAVGEPVLQRYCELLQSQWGCSHHRAVRPPPQLFLVLVDPVPGAQLSFLLCVQLPPEGSQSFCISFGGPTPLLKKEEDFHQVSTGAGGGDFNEATL